MKPHKNQGVINANSQQPGVFSGISQETGDLKRKLAGARGTQIETLNTQIEILNTQIEILNSQIEIKLWGVWMGRHCEWLDFGRGILGKVWCFVVYLAGICFSMMF